MSSLIYENTVVDYGDIQDEPDRWVGNYITSKQGFPGAYLIPEDPPYTSDWGYANGSFVDLAELRKEANDELLAREAEQKQIATEAQADLVRNERNRLLFDSDWTQGKDISDSISTPWAAYRQELRDVTEQPGFPWDVVWPQTPF